MKALIDAHLKEGPSLADVEEFRLLAGGMSQLTAYTMFLSDGVERWGLPNYVKGLSWQVSTEQDISLEDVERKLAEAGPWLRPYQAFGVGAGKDEEGRYMALVLVHADGRLCGRERGVAAQDNRGGKLGRVQNSMVRSY